MLAVSGFGSKSRPSDNLNGGQWKLVAEYVEVPSWKYFVLSGFTPRGLARNLHFVSSLQERGVDFVAADMPDAPTSRGAAGSVWKLSAKLSCGALGGRFE